MNTAQSVCPVCQFAGTQKVYSAQEMYYGIRQDFQYAECPSCQAITLLNPPQDMSKFYPENYHCHLVSEQKFNFKSFLTSQRDKFTLTKCGFIGKLVSRFKDSPTIYQTLSSLNLSLDSAILDVGCGGGELLWNLREIGFKNLTGIDPYLPESLIEEKPGFSLKQVSLEQLHDKYDAIMLNHSLEHMFDHEIVLQNLKRLLKPSGKICIRMPLSNSLAWQEYRTDWFQLDAPRHVLIHSENSFIDLAQKCDFKVEAIEYDSTIVQFSRSEIYKAGLSSQEFWAHYSGDIRKFFKPDQIKEWQLVTDNLNKNKQGDQAAFFLT